MDNRDFSFKNKYLITIDEFMQLSGIGENNAREIVSKDDFPKVMVGRNILIISSMVDEWLSRHIGQDLKEV